MRNIDDSMTCLLFDLDGTLIDSAPDISAALDLAMQDVGKPTPGLAACRQWIGGGVDLLIKRALAHSALEHAEDAGNARGAINPTAKAVATVADTAEQAALDRFLHHYAKLNGQNSRLYPGAREMLTVLKRRKISMACVTNKPEAFAHGLLGALRIAEFFPVVIGGDTLPTKKPDAAPLLHACEALDYEPDHAIMIGDSRADQAAANAGNIRFVWISHGYHRGETAETLKPWRAIDTLSALHDVLEC